MREIKFRGKRIDNGEFVYGLLCRTFIAGNLENGYGIQVADEFEMVAYEVDPETVGQFTGLRDNKRTAEFPEGQKIFDGDIVKDKHSQMFVVRWNIHWGAFCLAKPNGRFLGGKIYYSSHSPIYDGLKNCKVIGNVHEQSNLLGGEDSQ